MLLLQFFFYKFLPIKWSSVICGPIFIATMLGTRYDTDILVLPDLAEANVTAGPAGIRRVVVVGPIVQSQGRDCIFVFLCDGIFLGI